MLGADVLIDVREATLEDGEVAFDRLGFEFELIRACDPPSSRG